MKTTKKLAFLLTLLMAVSLAGTAFSAEGTPAEEGNIADAIGYVSCTDAELLALRTVQLRIGRDDCPWTGETEIAETVELYDFDSRVNGYLFRLKTGEKASGYVQVDAYAEAPQVVAFGYDCEAALDSMLSMQDKPAAASGDKIVYVGVYDYLQNTAEKDAEPAYCDIETGKTVRASAAELNASYRAMRAEQKDEAAKAALITLKAENRLSAPKNSIAPYNQIIYENVNVPNLWSPSEFVPYSAHDFPGYYNHCSPTCGMNMLKYWKERRGITNLYSSPNNYIDTFAELATRMKHINSPLSNGGTSVKNAYAGMLTYCITNNLSHPTGREFQDKSGTTDRFDWAWFTTKIKNGYPVYISTIGYPETEGDSHGLLGLGYQNCSDGQWIRVADTTDHSISHFLRYTWDYEQIMWYYRWN